MKVQKMAKAFSFFHNVLITFDNQLFFIFQYDPCIHFTLLLFYLKKNNAVD